MDKKHRIRLNANEQALMLALCEFYEQPATHSGFIVSLDLALAAVLEAAPPTAFVVRDGNTPDYLNLVMMPERRERIGRVKAKLHTDSTKEALIFCARLVVFLTD